MKKTLFLAFFLSLITLHLFSQDADEKAFKKGNFIITLGAGMGGYGTEMHESYLADSAYWDGTNLSWYKVQKDTTRNSGAVSVVIPLTLEYAVTNWLGLGLRGGYSNYLGKDSTVSQDPKVSCIDVDGIVNLHFIKSKHFDMPLCINVGYSIFTYKAMDALESMAKDNGINFGLGLNPRIYFGEHFGMHFDLKYAAYVYPSLNFSNSTDSNINDNNQEKFSLKGKGLNFGLGFQYKF
jgi:hypothetical protein